MNYAVRITKDNPALADLKLSWNTAVFSDEDGLAPLADDHAHCPKTRADH